MAPRIALRLTFRPKYHPQFWFKTSPMVITLYLPVSLWLGLYKWLKPPMRLCQKVPLRGVGGADREATWGACKLFNAPRRAQRAAAGYCFGAELPIHVRV
jgi:hypothetical protein